MRRLVAAVLLALALVAPAAAEHLVLADCQVTALAGERWLVRLRSTGPQAFDVERDGAGTVVRLHGARLGAVTAPEAGPFGTLTLVEDAGDVVVRLTPPDAGIRVSVRQGGSASEVEVRLER